jgi:hypothetical protein
MRRISWYHVSFIRETFHTFITFGVSNHSQFIAIGEIEELLWQMRFVAVKLIDNFDGDRWILLLFPTVCAENKLVILLGPPTSFGGTPSNIRLWRARDRSGGPASHERICLPGPAWLTSSAHRRVQPVSRPMTGVRRGQFFDSVAIQHVCVASAGTGKSVLPLR